MGFREWFEEEVGIVFEFFGQLNTETQLYWIEEYAKERGK